ncbi:hypothetical protein [Vibrio parahaemolyticus]|uniref:hypothetical protein n=1 Tax=Vibrio parahaemolyticus TaxID=670 RepID=UPI0023EB829B|nr:hypothetical protein [Vibrio parahaemolyticus]
MVTRNAKPATVKSSNNWLVAPNSLAGDVGHQQRAIGLCYLNSETRRCSPTGNVIGLLGNSLSFTHNKQAQKRLNMSANLFDPIYYGCIAFEPLALWVGAVIGINSPS